MGELLGSSSGGGGGILLLLGRRFFDEAGELAVVVFEQTEDAQSLRGGSVSGGRVWLGAVSCYAILYLCVVRVLGGVVEGGGGQVVLLPRRRDAVSAGRGRGRAGVVVGVGEMSRLHGGGGSGGVGVGVGGACPGRGGVEQRRT